MIGPIDLPWPDRLLSPNARTHWARKAKAVRAARHHAAWLVLAALGNSKCWWKAVNLTVEFCPPDNRRRDRDNLIASLKAATDGISDALGIDDQHFVSTYRMGAPVKGGAVRITMEAA